ncbi:CD40 ligand [Brachionichthys hirsutus]|uniref:CD40 ligand n=1 Tax=Brachionichthys hirsutus TaxID=412623 RepID=UPI003604515C
MINTYQTSLDPPPVPPRHSRSYPVLIPDPLPSRGNSKFLIRFLVAVVLLQLFLTVGGFLYLNHNSTMGKRLQAEGKAAHLSTDEQKTAFKPMARMVVKHPHAAVKKFTPGYLQWDIKHSFRRNINHYHNIWMTILQPGEYYVYSRVTFSSSDSMRALASKVKLRKNETEEEKPAMQAFCSLESHGGSELIPRLCTATQGEVMALERGNQLSVWVPDLSWVNYEEGATSFGMYKL